MKQIDIIRNVKLISLERWINNRRTRRILCKSDLNRMEFPVGRTV